MCHSELPLCGWMMSNYLQHFSTGEAGLQVVASFSISLARVDRAGSYSLSHEMFASKAKSSLLMLMLYLLMFL